MFLQKLYKHNKLLFALMIAFIIGQLFINYKHGMVFSPFYHYGMYSEVMKEKDNYAVFEIEVNGKKLLAQNFTIQQWDKIILPLNYYSSINTKSNALDYSDIKRLMNAIHIDANESKYIQTCNSKKFENWYQLYLGNLLNKKIDNLQIQYHIYQYKSGTLQPTDSILLLSQTCS
jgi:hypothetical protein